MTRFLLLVNLDGGNVDTPMLEWDEPDMKAHMQFLNDHLERLRESGELVEVQALTWPQHAKVVRAASVSAPVVSDWPATRWSTWSRSSGRWRSRLSCPARLDRVVSRSSSRSRYAG
jgi:hypothetical protein